jgi:surface carbohydrate biosynthesis protein
LNCDYYLSYNKEISKEFSKFIKARFIEIGSFNSNNEKKTYDKSIDFIYISQFKKNSDDEIFSGKTTFFDWRYNEIILLRNLSVVFKIRKIRLTVIGRCVSDSDSCDEEKFFRRFFPDLTFIRNIRNRKTYKFVDKAKVVIGIDSTLAYESFIRGNKTIFFSVRNYKKKNLDICRFCWPKKLKLRGSFWTNTYSFKEINRLLDLYYLNTSLWNKIYKKHVHNFGKYDFKNRLFLKLIKSLHNYKKFSAIKKN